MRDSVLSMPSNVHEERSQAASPIFNVANVALQSSKSLEARTAIRNPGVANCDSIKSTFPSNASTQTLDTAFAACNACAHMQQNLVDVGTALIALCESQGLESLLARQKKQLQKTSMSVSDVNRWKTEQNHDIEQITKHMEILLNKVELMELELVKSKKSNCNLREQLREVRNAKELVEMEFLKNEKESILKVEMLSYEHQRKESLLCDEVRELKLRNVIAEDRVALLENENSENRGQKQYLEKEVARLSESIEDKAGNKPLEDVEKELSDVKEQVVACHMKVAEKELELVKARTENKALAKHGKKMQSKQEVLLQRADLLNEECEQLQSRLMELEDEEQRLLVENKVLQRKSEVAEKTIADLKALVKDASNDKAALETTIKSLQAKVCDLESEVANTLDKLVLLSEYPFSSNTVNSQPFQFVEHTLTEERRFSLRDNFAKQIQANEIRVAVLEERNHALRQALSRLVESIPTEPMLHCK